jgi:hypothetical protein
MSPFFFALSLRLRLNTMDQRLIGVPCTDYLPSTTFIKSMNFNMYLSTNSANRSWMRVKYKQPFSWKSKSCEQKSQHANLANHTHADDSQLFSQDNPSFMGCKQLWPGVLQNAVWGAKCSSYFLLTYLLAYLLHGVESFLRS